MTNYGLTNHQIKKAFEKVEFNKSFMSVNGVQVDDKKVPFIKFVSNSYINSDRYVAELQHRAWSIYEYAEERELKNIFITLTLPSNWHPKKSFKNKLINNKKFSGRTYIATINKIKFLNCKVTQNIPFIEPILDFRTTIDKYTPRNASKELSKQLKRFFDDRSYKEIDKEDRCYFRVTEPHKDGTPHLHISLFVPSDKVERVVKALNRLYPAPMSKIEVNVNSPVSYLMKYVLKTLDDLRENNSKLTNLSLWYIYHGISRFYTSRTFVSLEVYRKLKGMYTLRDLTKDYLSEDLSIWINTETKKITKIENEHGTLYTPKPINWYDKFLETEDSWQKRKLKKAIDIMIDGEEFIIIPDQLSDLNKYNDECNITGEQPKSIDTILKPRPIHKMSDMSLYRHFQRLDIEVVDYRHYLNCRNALIERGYCGLGEWLKPQDINEILEYKLFSNV